MQDMFRIPQILEKTKYAILLYNVYHALEHQEMASWINSLARTYNLPFTITYYSLPPLDPFSHEKMELFFSTNWKQHMLFYDYLDQIGSHHTPPVFVFPKNYPSDKYDMDIESFCKLEWEIHLNLWRAIENLKS